MKAPIVLRTSSIPTTDRREFKQAHAAAQTMRGRVPRRAVSAWAELMKRALNGGDR